MYKRQLAFQPDHTELAHIPRTSGVTDLVVLATSRLMLDNFLHIRQLWNYVDEKLLHVALEFGVDDLGGTNFDETIAKAAGSQSKGFTHSELVSLIKACHHEPVEVDSTYTDRGGQSLTFDTFRPRLKSSFTSSIFSFFAMSKIRLSR